MHEVTDVRTLEGFRIWIKFSDNVEGAVDLSDVAGKGVFQFGKTVRFLRPLS